MNIYSNKRQLKIWLAIFAVAIFIVIIFYSNKLINNIAKEERHRIEIWADAISYKAELVANTEFFFNRIGIEEGKRAAIFAKAIQKVNDASFDEDLTFYQEIITSNTTIPSIMTQQDGRIETVVNVDPAIAKLNYIQEVPNYHNEFDSIKIQYDKKNSNKYSVVYYKQSRIYTDLKAVLDKLILSFFQEIVINSASVPVIITDNTEKNVITYGNIAWNNICTYDKLTKVVNDMKNENHPIKIEINGLETCYVFYENSIVLKQLKLFPFFQLLIVFIFFSIAYLLFSISRRSEQNQVWVGMSKETAHQLGTPISSLMAWNELLKEQPVDRFIIDEIDKDVNRLETISKRFSKIGSVPELKDENLLNVIKEFVAYLSARISKKVAIDIIEPENKNIILPVNKYLFEWVIENLCKNAVDAMNGKGSIFIEIFEDSKYIYIDVRDTGKGIPPKKAKSIFNPGFTTKSRGWGLGLTLSKRIIKDYHNGKIYVKSSTQGVGTVMRVCLKKGQSYFSASKGGSIPKQS